MGRGVGTEVLDMALGKRKSEQQELWVATTDLPRSMGHPFYKKLNQLLAEDGFDDWLEKLCAPHYHATLGRPSIPPGMYFRMILTGYFEGIGSQRGIAWRCGDSRSLAEFIGCGPTDETPDHSSLSRSHARLPQEIHEAMFQRVLAIAERKGLVQGKTVAVDSTTLEANAAMKSIVRRDTGDDYQAYLKKLAAEAGLAQPTAEDLQRFDKNRRDKKLSNDEWVSETDAESRITRMKDGTTHLAYKAEHVIDLESEFILAATVHGGDAADTATFCDSVLEAQVNLVKAGSEVEVREAVADKGYHAAATIEQSERLNVRTYIPQPKRPHRARWTDKPRALRDAVYANRRRVKGERSKRLQRRRSERVERSFAHVCETGGARRCWLTGLMKVTKRYLLQTAARNLGLILRKLFGMGTPRGLQKEGKADSVLAALAQLATTLLHALLNDLRSLRNLSTRPDESTAPLANFLTLAA
jgi:transposase